MKGRMNKKMAVVVAILIVSLAIGTVAFGAGTIKNLKAWYGDLKIFKNGQQVQLTAQPFIVDGTTYLPLRAMADILDKDITWDGAKYHIGINDRADANYNDMVTKFLVQQTTIAQLNVKVKDLEAQLAAKVESSVSNLSDMEKYLNKEYGTKDKVDFKINLYGSKNDIEVRMYIDDRTSSDRWYGWSNSDVKSHVQKIVDAISKDFKNAKVSGFIQDEYAKTNKTKFTVSSNGTVSVDSKSSSGSSGSSTSLSKLEEDLEWKFKRDSYTVTKIRLREDSYYDIELSVYVDKYEWDRLSSRDQTDLLDDISKEITWEYKNVKVLADVLDDYTNKSIYSYTYR